MPLDELADFYQTLTPCSLARLDNHYAADARFKDPFNEVRGLPAIRNIFQHMFDQVDSPRFVVTEKVGDGNLAFLTWTFHYRRGGQPAEIHGVTRLIWDGSGKVCCHRDYWDAAEELYMKLPLIGGLLRALRRRLSAGVQTDSRSIG